MLAAAEAAETAFRRAALGQRATVLWERPRGGIWPMGHGLTDNYLRVFAPEGAALWNRFSDVELVALAAGGVEGKPLGARASRRLLHTLSGLTPKVTASP